MPPTRSARISGAAILAVTAGLPLLGASLAGFDLAPIFAFPPPPLLPTRYPRFSWVAAGLVAAPFVALTIAWIRGRRACRQVPPRREPATASPALPPYPAAVCGHSGRIIFPAWGWLSLLWIGVWWILAWNRFVWFTPLQRFTFFPLWLGFIGLVNAATTATAGHCLLVRRPGATLGLFFTSAAFWWVFEWLNRFSHNWHYLGVADFGPGAYALNATLCFSTVLPAVASVAELLHNWRRFQRSCGSGPPMRWLASRVTGAFLLIAGIVALIGTGMRPTQFYAALWAAPLALLVADEIFRGRGLPADVATGDWRRVGTWATAALVCGFFWEMWNFHSAAKWIYTVPFVDRWHVFEMPLLGYTGYLPFGLECYFVTARVLGPERLFSNASST